MQLTDEAIVRPKCILEVQDLKMLRNVYSEISQKVKKEPTVSSKVASETTTGDDAFGFIKSLKLLDLCRDSCEQLKKQRDIKVTEL